MLAGLRRQLFVLLIRELEMRPPERPLMFIHSSVDRIFMRRLRIRISYLFE